MTVRVALNKRETITETIVTAVLANNREAMAPPVKMTVMAPPVNKELTVPPAPMTTTEAPDNNNREAMAPPVNKELMVPPPTTATEAPVKVPIHMAVAARKEAQANNNKDTAPVLKTPTEVLVANREVMALMIPPMAPALRTRVAILTAAPTIPPVKLAATHTENLTTRMDLEHRSKILMDPAIPMVNPVVKDRVVVDNMEMISEVEQLMIRMGADYRVDNRVDNKDMEMIL